MCDHLLQCTGNGCSAFGYACDLDGGGPNPCVEACVTATPCQDLTFLTLGNCQQACSIVDGGVPDAAVPDGGNLQACSQCTQNSCQGALLQCAFDTTCGAWLACVGGCADATCLDSCDDMYINGATLYTAIYACECTSCPSECAYGDPCTRGM